MRWPELTLRLPDWVEKAVPPPGQTIDSVADRMKLAVELARRNVASGTGGPFGAAVFERGTGRLVAPGVNMVVPANCSIAHAEIVALAAAQQVLGSHDLGGPEMPPCELVTSAEPCAMCLGAVHWSGVRGLICGARDEDARAVGFDEGPKPADWVAALEARGIAVVRDVLRDEAAAVLADYANSGGPLYNSRRGADA